MKAILISIYPKSCELIASGSKTVEIRKNKPKIIPPFKCYIYMTEGDAVYPVTINGNSYRCLNCGGRVVIGEFVCDSIDWHGLDELVVKEDAEKALIGTCSNKREILKYLRCDPKKTIYDQKNYNFYGWHISNLVIYDRPKELHDFTSDDKDAIKECKYRLRVGQPEERTKHNGFIWGSWCCIKDIEPEWCENCLKKSVDYPPKSWCYVDEITQESYNATQL